jgi:hypothetical protein
MAARHAANAAGHRGPSGTPRPLEDNHLRRRAETGGHDRAHGPCDGAMHGAAFLAYVEQVLVPSLSSKDIVVMDNLL